MCRVVSLVFAWVGWVGLALAGGPPQSVVQGLYEGTCKVDGSQQKLEARVVATGPGTYKVFIRETLPSGKLAKVELDGKAEGDSVRFTGKSGSALWDASYADGAIKGTCGPGTVDLKRVVRQSPTLGAKPPEGAIVLLDGKDSDELIKGRLAGGAEQPWKHVEEGAIEVPKGGMTTKRRFDGSLKLHVEFKLPLMPTERSQGRANSGVFLPNSDEIQVLDSFGMTTYKGGGCGGLYAYKDPDAFDEFSLASAPPLQWQTFDVEYRVQKKEGKPVGNPRVTVFHNGIKIHDNIESRGAVIGYSPKGKFHFQDHGNPVQYRIIWVLPLADP
jgi:hypothetical protein